MFVSLFSDMQHYNENSSITHFRFATSRHDHEELILQGRMSAYRGGTWLNLSGPHDILMAEARIVTPAGVHNLTLLDNLRHVGTFRPWHQQSNKPTQMEKKLIDGWKVANRKPGSNAWCERSHRSIREGKTCTGLPKPVVDLSDPPRAGRGLNRAKSVFMPTPIVMARGKGPRNQVSKTRRYTPILPKPSSTDPEPSSNLYHFKATTSNPVATVQLHPTPVKVEDSAFYMPGPEAISVTQDANCPVHGNAAQATKATQVTDYALGHPTKTAEQVELEQIKVEVEKNLVQMARMSRQNEQLLKIFLCKEEQSRDIEKETSGAILDAMMEAGKLQELGILKANPWMSSEKAVQPSTSSAHIAQQDPAIISTNYPAPSPASSYESVPDLETIYEDSDSDCVITGYTPPKKRNVVVKTEPNDSVSQLAKGTENLLL